MKGYDIKDLLPLSIYDLRVVGRSVGVKSPTSMRRNELIKNILSISNGEQTPVVQTNRGRPVKNLSTTSQIMERLRQKNLENGYFPDGKDAADPTLKNPEGLDELDANNADFSTTTETRGGMLDILPEGYGFLRAGNRPSQNDIYISIAQIRRFQLKNGDYVSGAVTVDMSGRKYPALMKVESVNDLPPENATSRPAFELMTPVYPTERYRVGGVADALLNAIDLLAPIGKGQRCLIAAGPGSGKTTLIKKLVNALSVIDGDVRVFVVLVDERPEDITGLTNAVDANIFSTTFDEPPQRHLTVAEWALERAKRQVEYGRDAVILLDSVTRLETAYRAAERQQGSASVPPNNFTKRFFGAARKVENGGSLTILATAFVDTERLEDKQIYEELSRNANAQIRLCGELAAKGTYPALRVNGTFTKHDDLLLTQAELERSRALRAELADLPQEEAARRLAKLA